MTATVRLLVDHALTTWKLNRVEIGLREEGTLRHYQLVGGGYLDCVSYGTLASRWLDTSR